jgi:hypothetical protein
MNRFRLKNLPLPYIIGAFVLFLFLSPHSVSAQKKYALIKGLVNDTTGDLVPNARIRIKENRQLTAVTDSLGKYSLQVEAGTDYTAEFYFDGKLRRAISIKPLKEDEEYSLNVSISLERNWMVVIRGRRDTVRPFMKQVNIGDVTAIPNISGGIEGVIKMLAGVSSNDELSSQYSVRGGNFDENLVYINGIEIYRPQLMRSGQEEGLSVINSDLVQSVKFSAGGFESKYGDKLSSVLDIAYREPDSFTASTSLSLLGAGASIGGRSGNRRFSYLIGARYRTNQYLLNTLDVQGDYKPEFGDVQAYLSYAITDKLKIGLLSYFGANRYLSIPETQQTTFGTVTSVVRLNIDFDGEELLKYNTLLNGLTATYQPNKNNTYKLINSISRNSETENFDIIGQYSLQQVESDPGKADYGDAIYTFGVGGYLNHARNTLNSFIYASEFTAEHNYSNLFDLQWGLKFQREQINDKLSEYRYIDSADYSIPQQDSGRTTLPVYEYIYSVNNQNWNRYMGYVQNSFLLSKAYKLNLTAGVRMNYWDYDRETLISPRVQVSFEPYAPYNRQILLNKGDSSKLKNILLLKLAGGSYQQPPFYRELRGLNGVLNPEIRAQKSWQAVAGSDLEFKMWDRPFKWTAEVYYKYLYDIIPYEVEDVRIRYFAVNDAVGYATGLDMQLNGDIVKDNPSWVSLSILKTAENLTDDHYTETDPTTGQTKTIYPGYIPRPTDQRFRFSLFFQDFLPGHPSYKVHLSLVYASGLPFGPPLHERYMDTLYMPPYRRVDIGFSKLLYDRRAAHANSSPFLKHFRSIWMSVEFFNMFAIDNTISYLWVQDVSGSQWAVPNYLTGRRVNLHLEIKF